MVDGVRSINGEYFPYDIFLNDLTGSVRQSFHTTKRYSTVYLVSVLDALSIYALTALRLPRKFISLFDKVRRRFTWDIDDDAVAGGKCKVGWQVVCAPMDRGGLGILHLDAFARALRLRWLWLKWQHPSRPWVQLGSPCDVRDQELFAAATRVSIGDGRTASFWWSTWLGNITLRQRFPLLFKHSRRKHRTVADALRNSQWVADLRRAPIANDFLILWREITRLGNISQSDQPDTVSWIISPDGSYSARSAYRIQFEGRQLSCMPSLVWDPWAPAKCKLFPWLLLQNRLWTADRLMQREWPNCYFCPFCIRNLETARHLLLDCPYARVLWASMASWPHCSGLAPRVWCKQTSLRDAWEAMINATHDTQKDGVRSVIILTFWQLWKERNNRVFNDKPSSLRCLLQMIRDEAQEWAFAGAKKIRKLMWDPP